MDIRNDKRINRHKVKFHGATLQVNAGSPAIIFPHNYSHYQATSTWYAESRALVVPCQPYNKGNIFLMMSGTEFEKEAGINPALSKQLAVLSILILIRTHNGSQIL